MELRLISDREEQLIFLESSSANLPWLPEAGLSTVKGDFGTILVQHIQAGPFTIYYSQYQLERDAAFYFAVNEPSLELHFMLANQIEYRLTELGNIATAENEFNITYLPYIENRSTLRKCARYASFDIHFDISYLCNFAGSYPAIDNFLNNIINNRASQYSSGKQKATSEIIGIIRSMLCNDFTGITQLFYLESKAIELLILALKVLSLQSAMLLKPRADDLERIYEAESIIMANLENPHSLTGLSRKVGTNDFKLKKYFKYTYGKPVHVYLIEARMIKAGMLVKDTKLPFADIAFQCGYKNVPCFNKAFRKHFLCTPGYMRKWG